MNIIKLEKKEGVLFNLGIYDRYQQHVGNLSVASHPTLGRAWLDVNIEEQYRCRWLTKEFAKFLYDTVIYTCQMFKIDMLLTRVNNPKSIRLLDFFGFIKYNKKYYYLLI